MIQRQTIELYRLTSKRPATFAGSAGFYLDPSNQLEGKYLEQPINDDQRLDADIVSATPSMQGHFEDQYRCDDIYNDQPVRRPERNAVLLPPQASCARTMLHAADAIHELSELADSGSDGKHK
jgi:hypothetical protein